MLIEEEKRSIFECFDALHSSTLSLERLQQLHYALKFNRAQSRYSAWPEADVTDAVAYIEALLPAADRLKPQSDPAPIKPRTAYTLPPGVDGPLSLFAQSLPYRPYVSNDLENYGLRIVSRSQADLFRYIQHNPPGMCHWLVLDCDFSGALSKVVALGLPLPNFVATNPLNGHSHLYYGLADPVCVTEAGVKRKPAWILRRVEYVMRTKLGSDAGYQGFISKNLLNDHWSVEIVREQLWKLQDFQAYFELPKRIPWEAKDQGIGRNVTLFDAGRREAYDIVLGFRLTNDKTGFQKHIHGFISGKNLGFSEPLYPAEIRSLVKSIVNWTWSRYIKRLPDEVFSKRQAARGKLGGIAKGKLNAEKRSEALKMASTGISTRAIAQALDVNQSTISRWVREG